jgi:hypothetical protein
VNAKPSVVTLEDKLQSRLGHDGARVWPTASRTLRGRVRRHVLALAWGSSFSWLLFQAPAPVAGLSLHVHDRDG